MTLEKDTEISCIEIKVSVDRLILIETHLQIGGRYYV